MTAEEYHKKPTIEGYYNQLSLEEKREFDSLSSVGKMLVYYYNTHPEKREAIQKANKAARNVINHIKDLTRELELEPGLSFD